MCKEIKEVKETLLKQLKLLSDQCTKAVCTNEGDLYQLTIALTIVARAILDMEGYIDE